MPPVITALDPPHLATDVALDAVVTLTFSEPVNPATVAQASFLIRKGFDQVPGRSLAATRMDDVLGIQEDLNEYDAYLKIHARRMATAAWTLPRGSNISRLSGEVGVMIFGVRDPRQRVHERDRFVIAGEAEGARNGAALERPSGKDLQLRRDLGGGRNAPGCSGSGYRYLPQYR